MRPLVSVIIVNWNGMSHLPVCLTSLRGQTYKDFEVILVDNFSTDGSVEYIQQNFPEVRVIQLDDNYGFAKANNIGISQTHSKYVALLNNDTEVDCYWLEALIECIEANDNTALVNSKMKLFFDRNMLDNAGTDYTMAGCCIEKGRYNIDNDKYNNDYPVLLVCAGAALYKREMFEKIGMFDEIFFYSYEDVDLSLRAYWAGYNAMFCSKAVVYHKLQATRKKSNKNNTYYNLRNNLYVWEKNIPQIIKIKYFLPRVVYLTGSIIKAICEGNIRAIINGIIDYYDNKQLLVLSRNKILRNSKRTSNELELVIEKSFLKTKMYKLFSIKKHVRNSDIIINSESLYKVE